jgi:hypothetical protein
VLQAVQCLQTHLQTKRQEASQSARTQRRDALATAAQKLCNPVLQQGVVDTHTVNMALQAAIRGGHLPVVRLLEWEVVHVRPRNDSTKQRNLLKLAAKYGHEDICSFFLSERSMDDDRFAALNTAAEHGHLGVVRLLLTSFLGGDVLKVFSTAVKHNQVQVGYLLVVET